MDSLEVAEESGIPEAKVCLESYHDSSGRSSDNLLEANEQKGSQETGTNYRSILE